MMKIRVLQILIIASIVLMPVFYVQAHMYLYPVFLWAKNAGGIDADIGKAIAVDGLGNSYITGYFFQTANFGGIQLQSYGESDIFIAMIDTHGNFLWAKRAGGHR